MNDRDRHYALFDQKGEDWVRENVTRKTFNDFKHRTALAWLDRVDRGRDHSDNSEQRRIAKSAKNAAWAAAIAAIIAAIAATVTAFIAFSQPPA